MKAVKLLPLSLRLMLVTLMVCWGALTRADVIVGIAPIPPYGIQHGSLENGIEPQIIHYAFATQGVDVSFESMRSKDLPGKLLSQEVNAIVLLENRPYPTLMGVTVYQSRPLIAFQNSALTLTESGTTVNSISELSGKRVVAFSGAKQKLGAEFKLVVEADGTLYRERKSQLTQLKVLFGKRYDVMIADKRIAQYWLDYAHKNNLLPQKNTMNGLTITEIIEPEWRVLKFSSAKLQQTFDKGLATIKQNGAYDKIIAGYQ